MLGKALAPRIMPLVEPAAGQDTILGGKNYRKVVKSLLFFW
jgi:hypothetical protein